MAEGDIVLRKDLILITGANGFIGKRVVNSLLSHGFQNLRCMVRPTSDHTALNDILDQYPDARTQILKGDLRKPEDCVKACNGVCLVYHLAVNPDKSFPGAVLNSVVPTRNLLDAIIKERTVKRILNTSTFAIYSNVDMRRGSPLDELSPTEEKLIERYEPYAYAKMRQEELVHDYGEKYGLNHVTVRPGVVYGPGVVSLSPRVGIDTFGVFFHIGGKNRIPLTYVDNCADAIVLAGLKRGIDGAIYNIVDDDLPTSREFLKRFKASYGHFRSIRVPYSIFYFLSFLWENYSRWSHNQLPPVFNRRRASAYWKGNRYSNAKLKSEVGWEPAIPYEEASRLYFENVKQAGGSGD